MRFPRVLLVVVSTALLPASGCGPSETVEPEPAPPVEVATDAAGGAEAVSDTATEVAFYGLVSWSTERDDGGRPTRLVALMPETSSQPECLGVEEGDPLEPHHPVLKVVTGSVSGDIEALEEFEGTSRIFSIAGSDVTVEPAPEAFGALATQEFDLLASTAKLNEMRPTAIDAAPALSIDPDLLAEVLASSEDRVGARVSFTQGTAVAALTRRCPGEPRKYVAEPNTDDDCPIDDAILPKHLADEVVVRLKESGAPVTLRLTRWRAGSDEQKTHTLIVSPENGSGVRIEIGHQTRIAAAHLDTRLATDEICAHDMAMDQRDYLWYYDLRDGTSCPAAALFPCPHKTLGGTICPQNGGG